VVSFICSRKTLAPGTIGREGIEVSTTIPLNVAVPLSELDGLHPIAIKEKIIDTTKETGKKNFIIIYLKLKKLCFCI
jgi:hypothetical protein